MSQFTREDKFKAILRCLGKEDEPGWANPDEPEPPPESGAERRVLEIARGFLDEDIRQVAAAYRRCVTDTDSPIEAAFLASVVRWLVVEGPGLILNGELYARGPGHHDDAIFVDTQHQIGKHRVDFLISDEGADKAGAKVVVECDGHNYHERTKEQAKRDRSRDRTLLQSGVPVVRFTGSEVWEKPDVCAEDGLFTLWRQDKAKRP